MASNPGAIGNAGACQLGLVMRIALLLDLAIVATNGCIATGLVFGYAAARKPETRGVLNWRSELFGGMVAPATLAMAIF